MRYKWLVLLSGLYGCSADSCTQIESTASAGTMSRHRSQTPGSGRGRQSLGGRWNLNTWPLLVLTGQSNSVGSGSTPVLSASQPYDNQRWNNTALVDLIETTQEGPTSGRANSMTYREPGRTSASHNWGVGSKLYTELKKGTAYYNNALTELDEMRDAVLVANPLVQVKVGPVGWIQGENDAASGTSQATYKGYMEEFQGDLQADYRTTLGAGFEGITVPLSIVQLVNGTDDSCQARLDGAIARGQYDAWKANPTKITVSHAPYFLVFNADNLHFNNESELLNGEYLSKVDDAWMNGRLWTPLSIASASCNANTIALTYQGGADSTCLVVDTTSVAIRPNYGFEYVESSPQADRPVITNVALNGCRGVTITLDRNCHSSGRIEYGHQYRGQYTMGRANGETGGGNIRSSGTQRAQGLAQKLWDWAILEQYNLESCTNCTESAAYTWSDATSVKIDNSPVGYMSTGHISVLDGATKVTYAFWRYAVTFNSGEQAFVSQTNLSHRQLSTRGTGTRALRVFIATSATDASTYWTSASQLNSTRYLFVVSIDLTQSGNDAKLDVWECHGGACTEISTAGTFTGTFPAALTAGVREGLAVGQDTAGSNNVESHMSDVAFWIGGSKWSAGEVSELYNSGNKIDARTHSRGVPNHYWPLHGNGQDVGSEPSQPLRPFGTVTYSAMP